MQRIEASRIATSLILALVVAIGCDKKPEEKKSEPPPATAATTEPAQKPPLELLEKATERRLHPDRAEASTFLWTDWNRFQENYHPLYLIDDDPTTAWVEGAQGDGAGEWVRVHTTDVGETTAVRLRLKNGYQKSESLFKKNARAKKLAVVLLPSRAEKSIDLKDEMGWQEFAIEQPAGKLSAVELRIAEIYPGTKYADLCLSDLEVHVTSRTPENPAFEKKKLEDVLAWKRDRVEAATMFASQKGKAMPIALGYRVGAAKRVEASYEPNADRLVKQAAMLKTALGAGVGDLEVIERASTALEASFEGWQPVEVSVKDARALPAIDGLYQPESYEVGSEERPGSYAVPSPGTLEFLTSDRLSAFESKATTTIARVLAGKEAACAREDDQRHFFYFRPKDEIASAEGVLRRLLVVECGQLEEREGYYSYAGIELLEYDDRGRLSMRISPSSITAFEWADDRIVGGKRVFANWENNVMSDSLSVAQIASK